jgi:NAD-dependent dihydropyrimidine dehydrogenase PreA subunit
MTKAKVSRRDMLKVTGVALAAVAGLHVVKNDATASEGTSSGGRKWAMIIDQSKCTGCGYCVMACRATNDISPEITWNPVLEAGQVGDKDIYLPRPCMNCEDAPCV